MYAKNIGFVVFSVALILATSACTRHDSSTAVGIQQIGSFAALQSAVITTKCASCHSGVAPAGGIDVSTYTALMKSGTIVPGDPNRSSFLTAVVNGSMPPGTKLSVDLVESIRSWIQNGAHLDSPLVLSSIAPNTASAGAQIAVDLSGQGFQPESKVFFGKSQALTVAFVSSNKLTAVSSALSGGSYDVKVVNPDGSVGMLSAGFLITGTQSSSGLAISHIFPRSGPSATLIEITGDGFQMGATVMVGNQPCVATLVSPPNQITCNVPRQDQSSAVDVVVINPDKTTAPFVQGFLYTVSASFTSIMTNILVPKCVSCHGTTPPAGGVRLTSYQGIMISGAVIPRDPLNSVLYLDVQSHKEPQAPKNGTKPPDLTDAEVSTIYNWILNGAYDDTPPVVTTIAPITGSTNGGGAVTINGSGFMPGLTVNLGSSACTPATVNPQGTQIQCVTSPAAAGAVDVIVINAPAAGITPLPSTGGRGIFTYVEGPGITSISPNSVKSSNQSPVTVTGKNFKANSVYRFGLVSVTPAGMPSCNLTTGVCTISFVPPPQAAAVVNVRVTNPDGQFFDANGAFAFTTGDAPTLSTISPLFTYTGRNVAMTLNGTGFLAGATVTIGGRNCGNLTSTSTLINCTVAAGNNTGSQTVVITNPDSLTNSGGPSLEVRRTITITTLNTTSFPVSGGILSVTGNGFLVGLTMKVGTQSCTPQVDSATSVSCNIPPSIGLAAATVDVVIKNPPDENNEELSAKRAINYVIPNTVTITAVNGGPGSLSSTTPITIDGSGFAAGTTVTVGGAPCASPVISVASIACVAPAGAAAGPVDVVVTNTNAATATSSGGFTYQ